MSGKGKERTVALVSLVPSSVGESRGAPAVASRVRVRGEEWSLNQRPIGNLEELQLSLIHPPFLGSAVPNSVLSDNSTLPNFLPYFNI